MKSALSGLTLDQAALFNLLTTRDFDVDGLWAQRIYNQQVQQEQGPHEMHWHSSTGDQALGVGL